MTASAAASAAAAAATRPGAPTLADVRRFAFRQGPGKGHLGEQHLVDDGAPTTSALPPRWARSSTGVPLPLGTHELLAATSYL
ncbi:hypothetical protein, partial [Streptomyces sp. NPDC058398]|uniref:hypothetical protein n=1 Tax=Streptomyces sp. NPDC058398 TaxID=3346479 RepID=UPI00365C8937